jgi:gas vesicle protein
MTVSPAVVIVPRYTYFETAPGGEIMADECGSGILWFLAGLGLGAALGVLYAPKAGREIRDAILTAAEESGATVKERARQYRGQAQEAVNRGRDYVSQQKDQIRSAFEAGREAYREATSTPEPEGGAPHA